MPAPTDSEFFDLGDVVLQHGATLRGARLAYRTYGTLNADRSNAIVYPTWFSGRHTDNEWLVGPGMALDPEHWTWFHGDVGQTPGFGGDTVAALNSIPCPVLAMPAEKDLYFPPEDEQWAAQHIPHGEVRVIPGVWGHFAGGGKNPEDTAFIDQGLRDMLGREV